MRILFVCTGNICRSPTAEGVLRERAQQEGLHDLVVDSAGTHGYHVGEAPDDRAVRAAARRGYDISGLRARKVQASDFENFDLVLAMDQGHLRALQRLCVPARQEKVRAFVNRDVPDPYYGAAGGFDEVLDQIEAGCDRLLEEIRERPAADRDR